MEIVDPLKYSYQAFSNVIGKLEYSNDMVDDTHDLLTMTRFMGCTTRSLRDSAFKNLYVLCWYAVLLLKLLVKWIGLGELIYGFD